MIEATWRHGPVSGPVNGALAAVVLAAAGRVAHVAPPWMLAPTVVGVATAVVTGRRAGTATTVTAYRAACWAAGGAWAAWTVWRGWSTPAVLSLLLAALAAGLLAPVLAHHFPAPAAAPGTAAPGESHVAALIRRVCGIREPITVRRVATWPGGTGYTLDVEFPAGAPYTWTTLRDGQVELAAAMHLPNGCPINAQPSDRHQGAALLRISTRNAMADPLPFPADYRPRSVRDPFPVGLCLDGSPAMVEVYQASGAIAGQRGGGKTVLLQDCTGQLHPCTDVVIWHVDLNGGGMSAPWMIPAALGEIERPTVDAIAVDAEGALELASWARAIAVDRKGRHQRLMVERNTDILPVSAQLPAIVIFVDEGGEVTGAEASRIAQQAAEKLREVQRIGRAMCVNVLFSVQRGTSDYVPSQMKKALGWAMCTRVKDDAELAHMFDWQKGLRSADLTHPGCAYLQSGPQQDVQMFKAYHLLPAQIGEIVRATAHLRPELDEAAQRAAGPGYARRWESPAVRAFMDGLAGREVAPVPAAAPVPAVGSDGTATGRLLALLGHPGDRGRVVDLPTAASQPVDQEPGPVRPEAPRDVAGRRALMVDLIDQGGADGIGTGDLVDQVRDAGVPVARQTVSEWLAAERDAGTIVQLRQGLYVSRRWAA